MTWYRIEGNMPQHQKYAPLSDAAFRLAVTAGAWCANMMTDGRLPKKMIAGLTRAPAGKQLSKTVKELVDAKIWDAIESDSESFYVHDFLDWNMSKSQWEAKKAAGSAGGKAKAEAKTKQLPKQKSSKPLAPASDLLEQNASTSSSVPLADSDSDSEKKEKKENLPRSPNGESSAKSDYSLLIDHYFAVFTSSKGDKPCFGQREGASVKKLLASVGGNLEKAKTIIDNAFRSYCSETATINLIANEPSKFIGTNKKQANGKLFNPPQPNAADDRDRYVARRLDETDEQLEKRTPDIRSGKRGLYE